MQPIRQLMHKKAVSCGELIIIGGQMSLYRPEPSNYTATLTGQAQEIFDGIDNMLRDVGASLAHLVKLVVFYKPQSDANESELRSILSNMLGSTVNTTITFVPVRRLRAEAALIEIEAYSVASPGQFETDRKTTTLAELPDPGASFCHGLRCGEFIFVSGQAARAPDGQVLHCDDLVAQNRRVLANIERVLSELAADTNDIVKANTWRAPPPSPDQYRAAAQDRFRYFEPASPALTGITVPQVGSEAILITIDVWAMRARNGARLPRQHINPEQHWDWSSPTTYSHGLRCSDYLFVGGQAALNTAGEVLHADDMAAQTDLTMDYVEGVLMAGQATVDDVVKTHTLCTGAEIEGNLHTCIGIVDNRVTSASASTTIPVDQLAYPGQTVEIEAIAYLGR